MRMLALLHPHFLRARNSLRIIAGSRDRLWRYALVCVLALSFLALIYSAARESLLSLGQAGLLSRFSLGVLLSPFILVIAAVGAFSSMLMALGSLFLAKDLDLIFSAPVSRKSIVAARSMEVLVASQWTGILLITPVILGFGSVGKAQPGFYLLIFVIITSVACLSTAVALAIISLVALILPAQRIRELLVLLGLALVVAIYLGAERILGPGPSEVFAGSSGAEQHSTTGQTGYITGQNGSTNLVLGLLDLAGSSAKQVPFLSSAAVSIDAAARGDYLVSLGECLPLLAIIFCLTIVAFLITQALHERGWLKGQGAAAPRAFVSRRVHSVLRAIFSPLPPQQQAFLFKDMRLFLRDTLQVLQLLILLGLTILYLSNFRMLGNAAQFETSTQIWWEALLVLTNLSVGGFVVAAVSTRFVYPAISLEGHAMWVVAKSPVDFSQFIRAKFVMWFAPLAIVACVVLTSGALAINATPRLILVSALSSTVLCYGLVGIAVGLGALYANFSWEHSAQLSTNVGAFLSMLASLLLILFSMLPLTILVLLRSMRETGVEFSSFGWLASVTFSAALLVSINFGAARWAMAIGARALEERRSG